ncbi:hypothetical protein Tco_1262823 [Tanacetum coccineum]
MVAYIQKLEGSEAFHQIVDFVNASHIKYALIENPKIYISLIQQFWGTATARTTDDGEVIFEKLALIGVDFPLFPTMITTPESSPSRITSSPSLSPQTYQSPQSSPLRDITRQDAKIPQSQFPTQTQVADEAAFTSVDVDAGGAATTDIGLEVGQGMKKLEKKVKTNNARRRARIVISEDEDAEEDSSKQGRKIPEIDKDPTISLVHPEKDMEYDFDVSTAEGFTTASVPVTTASETPKVSTTAENLVYIRRSAEKRKDKGKTIMKEDESV